MLTDRMAMATAMITLEVFMQGKILEDRQSRLPYYFAVGILFPKVAGVHPLLINGPNYLCGAVKHLWCPAPSGGDDDGISSTGL